MSGAEQPRRARALRNGVVAWLSRAVAVAALVVALWVLVTAADAVWHGHPAYAILLACTVALAVVALVVSFRRPAHHARGRRAGRFVLAILGAVGVAAIAWLKPFPAQEVARAALTSDAGVHVNESPTRIVLDPPNGPGTVAVMFQPGARVDARAYAASLLPIAEAGTSVVIVKQPLGIAFLALGALDAARTALPSVDEWIIGGHSLGGTVAAMQADSADAAERAPVVGLFFHASYPAGDISESLTVPVLSVSGSLDGLSTPEKIDASRPDLPADADFVVVDGAVHAQFGDYGPQPGDGMPTISDAEARTEIAATTVRFVGGVAGR